MLANLQKIGLEENESKLYLYLLQQGKSKASAISKSLHMNRNTVYDTINRLIGKGIASTEYINSISYYQVVPPEILYEQKKQEAEIALQTVEELRKLKSTDEKIIHTLQGREGVNHILQLVLTHNEFCTFGSCEFDSFMAHDNIKFQQQKKEKGMITRSLIPIHLKDSSKVQQAHTTFRYLPTNYTSKDSIWMFGNYLAFITWSKNPTITLIQNTPMATAYTHLFNSIWDNSQQ